jgi:phage terminase large subunit-like protein
VTVTRLSPEAAAKAAGRKVKVGKFPFIGNGKAIALGEAEGFVKTVLRGADVGLPVALVHAADGQSARAEPVAVQFESGKAKLAGCFPDLEEELAGLTYGGGYQGPGRSPDRADAMVWAMTELLVKRRAEPRIRSF